MALNVTWAADQVVFNSITWSNASGGVMRVSVEDNARELETRVGDNLYPMSVEAVDATCVATVELSEFDPASIPAPGTQSTLAVTIHGAADTVETMYNMKYMGRSSNQDRATAATTTLRFVFESTDGQKGPFTNPA